MKNRKLRKILLTICSAMLLVTLSVGATFAYLTSQDSVTNTFTVGKVAITLDETDVNVDGVKDGETRVEANEYKLMPGHNYIKDPVVHFAAGSEASWLFVKVENGIADIEAGTTIAAQIADNKWTALDGVTGVYYKEVAANTTASAQDYPVFEEFTIDGEENDQTLKNYEGATVKVTAYAVQKDGFNTAAAAWTATFGATATGN